MSKLKVMFTFWIMLGTVVLSNMLVIEILPRLIKSQPSRLLTIFSCMAAGGIVLGIFRMFNVRFPRLTELPWNSGDRDKQHDGGANADKPKESANPPEGK